MVSETVKKKFEKVSGKAWDTATKDDHDSFALSDACGVNWLSVWSPAKKKHEATPYKTGTTLKKDLDAFEKNARLGYKLACGGVGRGENIKATAEFKRTMKEKYPDIDH